MAYDILVVDDEPGLREMVQGILAGAGYTVRLAGTCAQALQQSRAKLPDGVLLDVMLPDGDGFALLGQLRDLADLPVLFLSARDEDADRLRGLGLGADDYITKPFSMEELTFRIEAILRRVRGKKNKESNIYKIGMFTFDTQKQILSTPEKQTKLTTKESELLGLLCAHANEILQRDFALKTIWIDDNYFNARSMDVYITKLRKHLKEDPSIEIINIHGKGYKLITPEPES